MVYFKRPARLYHGPFLKKKKERKKERKKKEQEEEVDKYEPKPQAMLGLDLNDKSED